MEGKTITIIITHQNNKIMEIIKENVILCDCKTLFSFSPEDLTSREKILKTKLDCRSYIYSAGAEYFVKCPNCKREYLVKKEDLRRPKLSKVLELLSWEARNGNITAGMVGDVLRFYSVGAIKKALLKMTKGQYEEIAPYI
jgi:hypothetical protein